MINKILFRYDDPAEFFDYSSILMIYLELKFSHFKELKLTKKDNDAEIPLRLIKKMSGLIHNLYDLEFRLLRFKNQDEDENLIEKLLLRSINKISIKLKLIFEYKNFSNRILSMVCSFVREC